LLKNNTHSGEKNSDGLAQRDILGVLFRNLLHLIYFGCNQSMTMTTKPLPSREETSSRDAVDGAPKRTKHAVLTDQLRELVTALRPGDRLPARDELMRRYQVSDRTVLRSLEDLQRAGWIVRRAGSGTYVTDRDQRIETLPPAVLAANAQQTIAVLAPHFFDASYLRLCANLLSEEVDAEGFSLTCRVVRTKVTPEDIQAVEAMNPLGVVVLGYQLADVVAELIARGHRAVVVGSPPADIDPIVPCIYTDHELGGYLAAKHLLDLGHRRIAFAYDEQMTYAPTNHPRWAGHQRAIESLRKTGVTVSDTLIDRQTFDSWWKDASLATAYFRQPNAPTGIAVWNDGGAIVLLGTLHRAGLRVPDDVSVIGFDAMPEGANCVPSLTSVEQHTRWQVQTALRLLSRPTPPPPQAIITLPELELRSSCKSPPLLS
jgi:GntR family transcriptional regulator of arabinose operon